MTEEGTREGEGQAGATRKEDTSEEGGAEIARKRQLIMLSTNDLGPQQAAIPACHPPVAPSPSRGRESMAWLRCSHLCSALYLTVQPPHRLSQPSCASYGFVQCCTEQLCAVQCRHAACCTIEYGPVQRCRMPAFPPAQLIMSGAGLLPSTCTVLQQVNCRIQQSKTWTQPCSIGNSKSSHAAIAKCNCNEQKKKDE